MAEWTCEQCGAAFARDRSGDRPIRFCGQRCYHDWSRAHGGGGGRFPKGHAPWNRDLKGIHLSPASEFKKGRRSEKWLPVGSVTIRKDKQGRDRAFVKIAEPNKWRERAAVNWEAFYGKKLPKGRVVHHKDRNTLNDAPANLQAVTRAQHIKIHHDDLHAAKREHQQQRAA